MTDVGGLDQLKEWLDRRGRGVRRRGPGLRPRRPEGRAAARRPGLRQEPAREGGGGDLAVPAAALRHGQGVRRHRRPVGGRTSALALQVAQALAPCVLWIDEIEKGLAGMGSSDQTDGGTTARVVGTLLTWMQEKRDPVFVVATANRIDMLPPELLRKGRFDEIFFVDLPHAASARRSCDPPSKKGRDPGDLRPGRRSPAVARLLRRRARGGGARGPVRRVRRGAGARDRAHIPRAGQDLPAVADDARPDRGPAPVGEGARAPGERRAARGAAADNARARRRGCGRSHPQPVHPGTARREGAVLPRHIGRVTRRSRRR
jgi:hypothetical protein